MAINSTNPEAYGATTPGCRSVASFEDFDDADVAMGNNSDDENNSNDDDDDAGPSSGEAARRGRPTWEELRARAPRFPTVDRDVRIVQEMLEQATARSKIKELGPLEVPDVRYTLRYKSRRGHDIDLRQSAEPFELDSDGLRAGPNDKPEPLTDKEPVIEIITHLYTRFIGHPEYQVPVYIQPRAHSISPPPPPPPMPRQDYYGPRTRDRYNSGDTYLPRAPAHPLPPLLTGNKPFELHNTSMIVKSKHLANAIRAVVEYSPDTFLHGQYDPNIPAPYEVLYHHREALARYRSNQPATHEPEYALTTARHIDVLLTFLDKTWGKEFHDEEALYKHETPTATYDHLWMLFKPGDVIFSKHFGKWTPFVMSSFLRGAASGVSPATSHRIYAWKITYQGDGFRRTTHELWLDPFTGEQAISGLTVVPARFFRGADGNEEPSAVLAEQLRLGKLMYELTKNPAYMSYEGNLASHELDDDEWSHPTNTTGYMSGRVMVDANGNGGNRVDPYRYDTHGRRSRHRPRNDVQNDVLPYFAARCGCDSCGSQIEAQSKLSSFYGFEDVRPKVDKLPTNDLYFIAIYKVIDGFILGERRWGMLNVDQLREVDFDREAFSNLVLDDEIKLTVKALIGKFASVQGRVSPWPNDFVKNKGQGRIFLLHGSPGVGKTCTAEATAELARRPLLSLTAGDLGKRGSGVERNLDYFLNLGERFGAIVLLDEADVYLERRRTSDIARNGLVSVFLRALEYYRGVLFLTTNRVEMFDAAFTSRIHVALHYGPLTDAHREKIWLNSFERLERDSNGKVHISASTREYVYDSRDVQSLQWNGREIRNALQTAVALAETEALGDNFLGSGNEGGVNNNSKITVTGKHLRAVVKMSRGFKLFSRDRRRRDDDYEDDEHDLREIVDDDESTDRESLYD